MSSPILGLRRRAVARSGLGRGIPGNGAVGAEHPAVQQHPVAGMMSEDLGKQAEEMKGNQGSRRLTGLKQDLQERQPWRSCPCIGG